MREDAAFPSRSGRYKESFTLHLVLEPQPVLCISAPAYAFLPALSAQKKDPLSLLASHQDALHQAIATDLQDAGYLEQCLAVL
jgi:hypothetical protein